jgi:hypothetical protein
MQENMSIRDLRLSNNAGDAGVAKREIGQGFIRQVKNFDCHSSGWCGICDPRIFKSE